MCQTLEGADFGCGGHCTLRQMNATESSVVDLTFASISPLVFKANVKSKTTLESDICQCPESEVRTPLQHPLFANFEFERTLEIYDSSVVLVQKFS